VRSVLAANFGWHSRADRHSCMRAGVGRDSDDALRLLLSSMSL
jgi:hypothetical protein